MKNILDNHHRFEMCIHVLQSDDHITHKHLPNKMIILLIEQFVDFSGGGGGGWTQSLYNSHSMCQPCA